jgi:endonuclease/exonuclease/phosphatase family metal-dependent hydrolase
VRAPRALIPLLAVAGAAAVVVTAGAGAAFEEDPSSGGPVVADASVDVPAATVNAMTWNVCGGTGCPMGADPAALIEQIERRMAGSEVGGQRVRMNAVFLQEVCSGHIDRLKDRLRTWSWAFASERANGGADRRCGGGQGELGVAVGAETSLSDVEKVRLPSPERHGRSAVCGLVAGWHTRLCSVQLSTEQPDDDPLGRWRAEQIERLTAFATGKRVIIGGDLAEPPHSGVLDPLYRDLAECDQGPNDSRTGEPTRLDGTGRTVAKTDYLFISKAARASCGVSPPDARASDHYPVTATVRFR